MRPGLFSLKISQVAILNRRTLGIAFFGLLLAAAVACAGDQGVEGPSGAQGPQGERGEAGPQGFPGEIGVQGPAGIQGFPGVAGPTGDTVDIVGGPGFTVTDLGDAVREVTVDFSGSGAEDTAAHSDHNHDETYARQDQLEADGEQLVHWGNLFNVPFDPAAEILGALSCNSGEFAQWDGTDWICATAVVDGPNSSSDANLIPRANTVTTLASGVDSGERTSTIIGSDGFPFILFSDRAKRILSAVHCEDIACTVFTITRLDPDSVTGAHNSVALGADGLPIIAYHDLENQDLKVAHCDDVACTSSVRAAVDTAGFVGRYNSIAIMSDGFASIAYEDRTDNALKYARCRSFNCSNPVIITLDETNLVGQHTSIAMGADGLPLIAYLDDTNNDLMIAHCTELTCGAAEFSRAVAAGSVGEYADILIGSNGLPLIFYRNSSDTAASVAQCETINCSSATTAIVASDNGNFGRWTDAAMGKDNLPIVAFSDSSGNDLVVAHCSDAICSSATHLAVATTGVTGQHSSIAVGTDGNPIVVFQKLESGFSGPIQALHCSNEFCAPYFRR